MHINFRPTKHGMIFVLISQFLVLQQTGWKPPWLILLETTNSKNFFEGVWFWLHFFLYAELLIIKISLHHCLSIRTWLHSYKCVFAWYHILITPVSAISLNVLTILETFPSNLTKIWTINFNISSYAVLPTLSVWFQIVTCYFMALKQELLFTKKFLKCKCFCPIQNVFLSFYRV